MLRLLDWFLSRNVGPLNTASSVGLLFLRVAVGSMMAFGHGWGKLAGFGERAAQFSDPYGLGSTVSMGLAVFAEFFCSLALALGLLTRAVVIPLIVTMLTAALIIHADDPWGRKEMALMYLIPFVTILIAGPGKYSLDQIFRHKH
jgi:putative oxidoreductase